MLPGMMMPPGFMAPAGGLRVQDVFAATLYTATNATLSINNGLNLSGLGGLVWTKIRSGATISHALYDTERGVNKLLDTTSTNAQFVATTALTSFNSNGFTLGADNEYGASNNSAGNPHVAWSFRKAAKCFDIKTGLVASNSVTIAHDLGIAPGMVICKAIDSNQDWFVYHCSTSSPTNKYLMLDSTSTESTFSGVFSASSTSFTISGLPSNGATFIFYLFAHDPDTTNGIIQCGSFTADGSGAGSATLPWEPQFLLCKTISQSGAWAMLDQTRGWGVGADNTLIANGSYAENGWFGSVDCGAPSSTGFTTTSAITPATSTAIYMAIRKGPM